MSSLISTASPWINEDSSSQRKRVPSMRKTVKIRPYARDTISQESDEYQYSQPVLENMSNIENIQSENESRSKKVNDLINQMTNVNADNDGQGLADFRPPPIPEISMKKTYPEESTEESISPQSNPLQIPIPMIPKNTSANPYVSSRVDLANYGSYQTAYEPTNITPKPFYARMGLGNSGEPASFESSRLLEKINYMIHLLEGQENEKTANVTEEFILYTFLGVFIIYVVDSFNRGGKYVR
jgi:hypothetical protein